MKKRGFGTGKWNGVGGKKRENETLEEAAVREIKEEVGIEVKQADLVKSAHLIFNFENNPDWNHDVTVYIISAWEGEPTESEELAPKWYSKTELPFEHMWVDDRSWLPLILSGKKVEGTFLFNSEGTAIINKEVIELP